MTTAGTLRYTIGNASPQHEVVGAMRISQGLQVGPNAALAPLASARIATRDDGSPDGVVGVLADLGTLTAPGAGSLIGVAGHAIGKVSPTVAVRGLDFIAGSTARALNDVDNIRVQAITLVGTGLTIVNCHGLLVRTPSNLGFTITNNYGVRVQTMGSTGDNRRPFQDESTANESNNHGNRFLSNTQFASLVGAFGGGRGVVGIANAPQVPVSNPAAGGVLYAEAGALKWRGSAGTVTTIAIA